MAEHQDSTQPQQPAPVARQRRRRSGSRSPLKKLIRRIRKRVRLRTIAVTIVVALIVAVVSGSLLISNASSQLMTSWDSLSRVLRTIDSRSRTELTLMDLERLQTSVNQLSGQLRSIRSTLTVLAPITSLNADTRVTYDLLEPAQNLTAATNNILNGLRPALVFMVQGNEEGAVATGITSGERLVELLEIGQESFIRAQNQLRTAEEQLAAISLDGVSTATLVNVDEIQVYLDQVTAVNDIMLSLPETLTTVLGLTEERAYLILSQNSDELRPSGGYISTYGWMTMRNARVEDYSYSATTATSPNPPRESFIAQYTAPEWWIGYGQPVYLAWDGSWHPDFSKTAQMAIDYYNAGNNPESPADGAIAIDIIAFEMILNALGSVDVPQWDVTVTGSNFRDLVYDIRAFGRGEQAHKQFVADIFQAIFEGWQLAGQEQSQALLQAILQGLQEKHIMLYFTDETLNQAINLLGWSGTLAPAVNHDYVMVADANVTANKSNSSIRRQLTYDVAIQPDDTLDSRLSIGYEYFNSVASSDPAVNPEYHGRLDYFNQLQVLVPVNAQLDETENFTNEIITEEQDMHTLYTSLVEVPYDTNRRVQLNYTTDDLVQDVGGFKRYRLLMQKQPGTRPNAVTVQVTLPENARIIATDPPATAQYDLEQPILDFRLILDADKWIEVIYQVE